jgi:predicted nucleic acid-binding Zn ribbon protein
LERIAGHGLFTEAKVRKVWPAVVGANVAANASVRRLRGKALEVDVPSDAWATELSYLSAAIVQKLNARLGADTVDKLIVRRRRKR